MVAIIKSNVPFWTNWQGNKNTGSFSECHETEVIIHAQQSFFSQKWRVDATEALRRFIEHVESSKWASRIIGYHLAYGTCGETTQWGSWSPDPYHKGDYGINATKAFLEYAAQKGEYYDAVPPIEQRFYIEKGSDTSDAYST